jgi:membrane protease YdiL (CAAX protease family)
MTWSWFSIFSGDSNDVGNVITQPFNSGSIPLILSFWVILCIALPYLAKIEEEIFRSNILTLKKRVLYSLYFGFAHMVMGVSITVSLVLSVVGFIYSIFYIREYNRIIKSDPDNANTVATLASSSIHTKYNFILVTLLAAFSVLLCIVN